MITLSLCMIVKNESQNLARCLDSVKAFVDEIVIIDTGSSDSTIEIAQNYGAKVDYFAWCNDFAAARNYSLSKATGEWILFLDADEELVIESNHASDPDPIRNQVSRHLRSNPELSAFLVPLRDLNQETFAPSQIRLFRNRRDLQFVGRFHERLAIADAQTTLLDKIHILHHGYTTESVVQKNEARNILLLEQARQAEGLSLRLLSCLAGMYETVQQPEKAEDCYREAFDRLLPHFLDGSVPDDLSYLPQLMFNLAVKMLAYPEKDFETLNLLCLKGLEWFPKFPPFIYLTGTVLRATGFTLGATAYFEKCLELERDRTYSLEHPFDRRYMTTYAAYDLGCVYCVIGDLSKAIAALELALSFDPLFSPAQTRLQELANSI
jgi:glycosyltransferase involved in cell wall biosynthesis